MLTERLTVALAGFAAVACAQTSAGIARPVTGFFFDAPSGAIRAMLGVPGAALSGTVMATGLAAAAVAPDGSAALGLTRSNQLVLYTGLRSATPQAQHLNAAIVGPSRFAWAPDAASAALYSPAGSQAQILAGLPTAPRCGAPVDTSSLPGPVAALAFDGQRIAFAVSGDSGGVFLASASKAPERIASASSPAAIVLAGDSLFFADNRSQQIWRISGYATAPAAAPFVADSTVSDPAALEVSADGQRLLVANAGGRKLTIYQIASRSLLQTVGLAFTPTRLDRFGDPSVFLMNGGDGPLYVARDSAAGKAAVFFVPVPLPRPLIAPGRPL